MVYLFKNLLRKWPIAYWLKDRAMSHVGRRSVETVSFSVLPTHGCGGKKSIWQRICWMHCPSPHFTYKQVPGKKSLTSYSSCNFPNRNTEAPLANFSPNHKYVGWVTWAPFTALQLCKSNYCALGSQFIKWGRELSASLMHYNNSSIKANNAWEKFKVILWNWRGVFIRIPTQRKRLNKMLLLNLIRKWVITSALFLVSKRQLCKAKRAFTLTFPAFLFPT